jgi:hypothetical protein
LLTSSRTDCCFLLSCDKDGGIAFLLDRQEL